MSGGNCPETPRQKMIGMMYLMLTAMLALNVSGDLLNAFDLVDKSIREQVHATEEKLGVSFINFESKSTQNPTKVKPKYDQALEVKKKADDLYNLIQGYKQEIIDVVDGKDTGSTPENYLNKSDQDNAATVMIVMDNGARAKNLRESIGKFRDEMAVIAEGDASSPKDEALQAAIKSMLKIEDGVNSEDGSKVTWESQNFEHLPVAAVMGLMSAMQSNVRNVETDVVNYLYKAIDAASFKFNTLVPLIIPEAQYVLQGGQYKADIMLAAYDDTMEPIVSVGGSQLKVESGMGKYTAAATSVGNKTYTATLQIPDPVTGELKPYTVEGKYEVGAPSLVVAASKMNAMYRGLNNPIDVSLAGVSPSDLIVNCAGGTMTRDGNGYTVKPGAAKEITISVQAKQEGKTSNMGSKTFRVFDVPNPEVKFTAADAGNKLNKSKAKNGEVIAELKDFVFDVSFKITSFEVSTTKGGFLKSEKQTGSGKLNSRQQDLISGSARNSKIYIENVKAMGPDGRERSLGALGLTVQ